MAKTATFSLLLGLLFAWNWGRLETGRSAGEIALMILLGVAPALLPSLRLRLAGAGVALIAAWSIALDVRPYALGTVLGRTGRGFLDFYDVLVPFSASEHHLMDGVVLLAIFTFTALASLAIASRRPLLASLVLVAGAGWPSTIFPGHDDLGRGVLLLLAALALVARLGPTTRRGAPQVLVATDARGHCAHRLELERRRESAVPRLAEVGPVDEGWALRQRRVRLERELPRRQLPEEADARVHRQDGRPARRLLASDDARHVRRQRLEGGTAPDRGSQAARRVPRPPHGRPAAAEARAATPRSGLRRPYTSTRSATAT